MPIPSEPLEIWLACAAALLVAQIWTKPIWPTAVEHIMSGGDGPDADNGSLPSLACKRERYNRNLPRWRWTFVIFWAVMLFILWRISWKG